MKRITLIILLIIGSITSSIASSSWEFCVADSIRHPLWPGKYVYFIHSKQGSNWPVVLFCHGITAENPMSYQGLIDHFCKQGFAVVYSSFKTSSALTDPENAYKQLTKGFSKATQKWAGLFDSTRVCVVGHSYGGGAAPSIAYQYIVKRKWGMNGTLLYIMAPWYSWNITDEQLKEFPQSMRLCVQVYEDDNINDHRMAIDLFNTIKVPGKNKSFSILYNDTCGSKFTPANHGVPNGDYKKGIDCQDCRIYNIFDSLTSDIASIVPPYKSENNRCVFYKSEIPLQSEPAALHSESFYINFWDHLLNPRAVFTTSTDSSEKHEVLVTEKNYLFYSISYAVDKANELNGVIQKVMQPPDLDSSITRTIMWHPGGSDQQIAIYTPRGAKENMPVVLFCPNFWNGTFQNYNRFLKYIARKGFVVVTSSYHFNPFLSDCRKIRTLIQGFDRALDIYKPVIDTSKIVIVGHSFGGGAAVNVADHFNNEKRWGDSSMALLLLSPRKIKCGENADVTFRNKSMQFIALSMGDEDDADLNYADEITRSLTYKKEYRNHLLATCDSLGSERVKLDEDVLLEDRNELLHPIDSLLFYRTFDWVSSGFRDKIWLIKGTGSLQDTCSYNGVRLKITDITK